MRILIVEDDPEICEAMQFALEREKHTVDICHHGDEGLQWLLRGRARFSDYGPAAARNGLGLYLHPRCK